MIRKILTVAVLCAGLSPAWAAKNAADDILQGNAAYRRAQFDEAINHYQEALSKGGQEILARYNLGNALFKAGLGKEDSNIDVSVENLQESIQNYDAVLSRKPRDKDAQYNKQFVSKELERIKKKQKERREDQGDRQKPSNSEKSNQKDPAQSPQSSSESQEGQDQKSQSPPQEPKPGGQPKPENAEQARNENRDQEGPDGKRQEDRAPQAQDRPNGEERMSTNEAKDILNDYQRNEEPKGLLSFFDKEVSDRPVLKDW